MEKGDKFGSLRFTGKKKNEKKRWLGEFTCECGKMRYLRLDIVKSGNTKSCGCKSPNKNYKEKRAVLGSDYPFHVLVNVFRKNAKTRKIPFAISVEDVKKQFERQMGLCAYTNRPLTMPENFLKIYGPTVASIDRIDSDVGYTPANIQIVCKIINVMKSTLSHKDFISTCKEVSEHHSTLNAK